MGWMKFFQKVLILWIYKDMYEFRQLSDLFYISINFEFMQVEIEIESTTYGKSA